MLAALMLEELLQITKTSQTVTPQQLNDLYKTTWKEAFKEGRRDARQTCGCQEDE